MAQVVDYLPVVMKLLAKTQARKIEWKGTYDSTTFICAIEGEYGFEIEKGKLTNGRLYRKLTMKDKEQVEVFVERAFLPSEESSQKNDELFEVLDELYERARMTALDIDKKLSEASDILDKI
jgi:hypothetical protein